MAEQIKKIETPKEIEVDEEALEKIRKIQSSGFLGGFKRDLFFDINKEIFSPIQEKFHKKYPNINWDIVSGDEFPQDYAGELEEAQKKFNEIIKNKSETEILERAKQIYQFEMEQNKNFEYAYKIAGIYLDKKSVKKAAEKTFHENLRKMEKSTKEDEKIKAADQMLSSLFVPEIERGPKIIEEAFKILLQSEYAKKNPDFLRLKIMNFPRASKWQLPKSKEIFNFVNPFARNQIEKLIEKGNKKEALDRAESYEKNGFLDFESDNDLFEELTKQKP